MKFLKFRDWIDPFKLYANGLLIETCSINFINNKSNLKFK